MIDLTFKQISGHKLRTALTIIGIAVGIGLVIALGAIGEGVKGGMEEAFTGVADVVEVHAIDDEGLSEDVIERISYIEGVEKVIRMPEYWTSVDSGQSFMGISVGTAIYGIDPEDQEYVIGKEIIAEEGRMLEEEDAGKKVALVGYTFAKNTDMVLGSEIPYKNDTIFEIIGILEEIGKNAQDYGVYVPLETMLEIEEEQGESEEQEVSEEQEEIIEYGPRYIELGEAKFYEHNFIGRTKNKLHGKIEFSDKKIKVEDIQEHSEADLSKYIENLSEKDIKNLPENKYVVAKLKPPQNC